MRTGRAIWMQRVRRWRRSGQAAREFATSIGVNPATLTYWAWRLKREERNAQPRLRRAGGAGCEPPFVEVIVDGPTQDGFVPELGDGRRLRIPAGVEVATLTRVLAAPEGARR